MPIEYPGPEDTTPDKDHEDSSLTSHVEEIPFPHPPTTPPIGYKQGAEAANQRAQTRRERTERAQRYLEQKRRRREQHAAALNVTPEVIRPDNTRQSLLHQHVETTAAITRAYPVEDDTDPDIVLHQHPVRLPANPRRRRLLLSHISRRHLRDTRHKNRYNFHRFWLTILGTFGLLALILLTITGAGTYVTYRFYNDTSTTYQHGILSLRDLTPRDNLKLYDSKGILLSQLTDQGMHTEVPLDKISPLLINATVATEDKNFWKNSGLDIFRILEAGIQNLQHGRVVEGGSTITQQLIKNLLVGSEANVLRKLQEFVLTPEINSRYSKSDIIEMYLNTIYFGHQAYGIDAAASAYFGLVDRPGKPASAQLDLAQSAMLAGMPSSPSLYDPDVHPQTTFNRFNIVLDLMIREGYITQVQADAAIKEAQKPDFFKGPPNLQDRAPHFTQYVLLQLEKQFKLKRSQLSRSGLMVYTTLDIDLQDKIQKIMQQHIDELQGHNITNAAEVLIDYHTGAIRSLLGSLDYNSKVIDGKFDVATMGYRQPGSSFKPYVYATALGQGYTPAQAIEDSPLIIQMPPGSNPATYEPKNYDKLYHGHVTLRCALQNSLNIPAVKTLQHVGINNSLATARAMGITDTKGEAGYSMVLGGLDVNLLEHTTAFGAFANKGKAFTPYAIQKVVTTYNKKTTKHQSKEGKQAISPQVAYMMTDILSDNNSRLPEFFDCNPLQLYSNSTNQCYAGNRGVVRPAAAKTGTTNDFRDNWTMGYTTDFVMGVWAGNNNYTPMNDVTGIQGAAPIWHDSMLLAEQGKPVTNFSNPGGLDKGSMIYPDGIQSTDWYLPGHYPTMAQAVPSLYPTSPVPTATETNLNPFKTEKPTVLSSHPYCSNYSFAFPTPNNHSSNRGWW
ncbi:hypothetical protein KDA_17350 [Dictyobacter alpinus]|uniref:Uncharacterized protein n=1 Tax=Dictyobacter alpinus TaxID=2014873 RepID=A0A402B4I7_9CHLR|nr:PBP1A family penicillin-binding protein [Dictyobacter alpinus]GCE26251.1 hypothetical protein KDA_17350 [Dictyobacter alpinus]